MGKDGGDQILVNHKHINLNNGSYQIAGAGLGEITRQGNCWLKQNPLLHIKVSCFNLAWVDGRMCTEG